MACDRPFYFARAAGVNRNRTASGGRDPSFLPFPLAAIVGIFGDEQIAVLEHTDSRRLACGLRGGERELHLRAGEPVDSVAERDRDRAGVADDLVLGDLQGRRGATGDSLFILAD